MRRVLAVLGVVGMAFGVLAAPALSDDPPSSEGPPPHPHMLVIGLELDENEEPVSYRRCVDLAAGKPVPNNAHHAHVHRGQAGEALWSAGHAAVPGAPLTPWSNCDELVAYFFGE